jgi:hypothetical protein
MDGGFEIAPDSRAFTHGRSTFGHGVSRIIPRQVPWTPAGFVSFATFVGVETDTGKSESPAWLVPTPSPVEEALAEQAGHEAEWRALVSRLHARIGELKKLGSEEELPWSAASEEDFWTFVRSRQVLREPGLILMDNGNLRAMWRNTAGEQIGLEFRGYSQVYYVFFARRPEGPPMARSAGEDSIARIGMKIAADNLTGLVSGQR